MKQFYKVTNKILKISSKQVTFANRAGERTQFGRRETTLLRVVDFTPPPLTVWQLRNDGIYVRREFATAYDLILEKN